MGEKEFRITKNIKFTVMKHYRQWSKYIIGITANKEEDYVTSFDLHYDTVQVRHKFELNLWLLLVSFHITVYTKLKRYK